MTKLLAMQEVPYSYGTESVVLHFAGIIKPTMKKLLFSFAVAGLLAQGAFAQGQFIFENFFTGDPAANAPVTDVNGVLLPGPSFAADLLYGTSATTVTTDAGLARGFSTGTGAGYFIAGAEEIPLSGTVFMRIVVWQGAAGASWAAATGGAINYGSNPTTYLDNGGTEWGFGNIFSANLPTSPGSPFNGLILPLQLQAAPEPASLALGGLGAGALLLFRRRKP